MMCPSRSPFWFTQTTSEAEPKLRMVFGKGKVQRQETVLPALLRAVNARLAVLESRYARESAAVYID